MSGVEVAEAVREAAARAPSLAAPLSDDDMRRLTDAVNTLIANVIRIIITHDPEECASNSKYNRPCETCQSIGELRGPAKTIIKLSEKMRREGGAI